MRASRRRWGRESSRWARPRGHDAPAPADGRAVPRGGVAGLRPGGERSVSPRRLPGSPRRVPEEAQPRLLLLRRGPRLEEVRVRRERRGAGRVRPLPRVGPARVHRVPERGRRRRHQGAVRGARARRRDPGPVVRRGAGARRCGRPGPGRDALRPAAARPVVLGRARVLRYDAARRREGYGKVILAGQSFGGYITLDTAESSRDVYGVVAMAPGIRFGGTGNLDASVTERTLGALTVDRLALDGEGAQRPLRHRRIEVTRAAEPDARSHRDDAVDILGGFRRVQRDVAAEGLPGQDDLAVYLAAARRDLLLGPPDGPGEGLLAGGLPEIVARDLHHVPAARLQEPQDRRHRRRVLGDRPVDAVVPDHHSRGGGGAVPRHVAEGALDPEPPAERELTAARRVPDQAGRVVSRLRLR